MAAPHTTGCAGMSPQPCPWQPLGAFVLPNGEVGTTSDDLFAPVSGRVTTIWADPARPDQTLYVGTALGGVWHTDDGGATWTPILDGEATLAVGALTVAGGVLYVGTGEANGGGDNAAGLGLISVDLSTGTRTRDYLPQFAGQVVSRVMADSPTQPANVYVASSNGLWRKELAHGTWTELEVAGPGTGQFVTDVLISPGGRIWAGVYNWGVVTLNRNDKLVYPPESLPRLPIKAGVVSLAVCWTTPQTMYAAIVDASPGTGVRLFRSDNAPISPDPTTGPTPLSLWREITPPKGLAQLFYTNVVAVHPQDPDVVYYGETHLWRSKNGGDSWELCSRQRGKSAGAHVDQHALVIEDHPPAAPKSFDGVKLWAGNDGGVWRSVDGGATWKPRNRGLNTMQYFASATHPTERRIVAAGAQDNGTQRYLGDGAWELADVGDGSYVAFDPVDPTVWYDGYVAYAPDNKGGRKSFAGFLVSTASGRLGSYQTAAGKGATAIGATDEALFYAPFIVVPPTGGAVAADIWVGTDRLYHSSDRGEHWLAVTGFLLTPAVPNPRDRGISCIAAPSGAAGRVYAGTSDGRFYRVDQTGGAWSAAATSTRLVAPGPPPGVPVLEAAGMAAGAFISAIAAARLPTGLDRVVVSVGRDHLGFYHAPLAGGEHLFVSSDSGATFVAAAALPDVVVPGRTVKGSDNSINGLVLDPANPDIVFVACDTGVFRYDASTPAVAPEPWRAGLPNTVVMGIEIVPSPPRLLRVATHGRGVWETELDPLVAPQVCAPALLVVRETIHDDGSAPSPVSTPDPFEKGKTLSALSSLDIAIDVPNELSGDYTVTSTVDYTPTGQLDYIGFHDLAGGSSPTRGAVAKVHVRVHNRGTAPATQVKVALAWADNSNPLPNLPTGFFTPFPADVPAGGTSWPTLGPLGTIARIGPGESGVATFDWSIDANTPFRARLLVAVSCQEDPFVDPGLTGSAAAAMQSRFVAVRDVEMSLGTRTWLIVLVAVGVVVAGAAVIAATE